MAEILNDLFKSVIISSDGNEALHLYHEYYATHNKNFDLVITDIQMPLMNGVELCEALYDIRKEQKIIVLSAHTDSDYLLKLINLGIDQFLTKPIDHEKFMDTLSHVSKKFNTIESEPKNILLVDLGENYNWDIKNLVLKKK